MQFKGWMWGALALLAPAACGAQSALEPLRALIAGQHEPRPAGPVMSLDEAERIALAENPEIRLALRKVHVAQQHVAVAGALEDPQAMVREWSVPLAQPWDYNAAQNMFMVGQPLPGPGKRALRTAAAQWDVTAARDELAETQLRVRVQARKAFFDLLRAQEELRIHDQHVEIATQAIEAAKIKYTAGKIPQVEVVKAQLALTRLAEHMIRFDRDAGVAQARLNTALGREPGTAIQVKGAYELARELPSLDMLEAQAMKTRPDLLDAEAAVGKSRSEEKLAGRGLVPDFNVAAGYMLMPTGSDFRNNYMLEGSMTLPWLNRRRHANEIAEAAAATQARDAELDAMRNAARGQIGVALAEAKAAQRLARVYQDALRQQSEEALHAAVIAYENDQTSFLDLLDSQMTVIDVDLAWVDALAEFDQRLAELEMAVGGPIEQGNAAQTEDVR